MYIKLGQYIFWWQYSNNVICGDFDKPILWYKKENEIVNAVNIYFEQFEAILFFLSNVH